MTNQELIATISADKAASLILRQAAKIERKYIDSELDAFDIIENCESDFEKWLKSAPPECLKLTSEG